MSRTRRILLPLLLALTLGLAPFVPEPHLWGKLRWIAGGAQGMGALDWFDVVWHGFAWVWLAIALVQLLLAWWFAFAYDRFMAQTEAACLADWRAELLGDLEGDVLDLGAGTGANLPYLPPGIRRYVAVEPEAFMRERLEARADELGMVHVEAIGASGERLPFADDHFDAAVVTLVLCSVTDPRQTLAELYRVLKPGGRLVFLEHVAAHDNPGRLAWQRRIEPFWKRMAGNCHLTRNTAEVIASSGFEVQRETRESMRKALAIVRPSVRGFAVKPLV